MDLKSSSVKVGEEVADEVGGKVGAILNRVGGTKQANTIRLQKTAESGNCWPGVCNSHCLGAVNSAIDILLHTGTNHEFIHITAS